MNARIRKLSAFISLLLLFSLLLGTPTLASDFTASEPAGTTDYGFSIDARGAVLIEAETGTVLFEQNADAAYSPASVTKIMTLLLVMEALESGKLAGAALDVYEREPVTADLALNSLNNILLAPPVAALSVETNYNAGITCAESVIRVYRGEPPLYPVL